MRKLSLLVLAVLLMPFTLTSAQETPDPFPTVTALEQTTVPPRDRVELAADIYGITEVAPPPAQPHQWQIGDRREMRVSNSTTQTVTVVTAELRAIGDHIYLWFDVRAPGNHAAAQELADNFDANIYHQVRDLWGTEASPGVDGDPRVHGLFAYGVESGTLAYYSTEHGYPVEVVSTSNEHEMFVFNLNATGINVNNFEVESTTAHEFQHMIRANVHPNADTWMNEGLSMFTERYLGYPGTEWAARAFLAAPYTQVNTWAINGPTAPHYGGGLLYATYFYERFGLKPLQRMATAPTNALKAVDDSLRELGEPGQAAFFADWVVANLINAPDFEEGHYHYTLFPELQRPFILDTTGSYPYTRTNTANQYATDYYRMVGLDNAASLTVSLEAPETVQLIPTDASSGVGMWYGNRADDSYTTLTRAFDLTDVDSATLQYDVWYQIEDRWDYGYLMVSEDDGQTWDILPTPYTTTDNPFNNAYGSGYTGDSGGWVTESISLDAYTGREVLVRFAIITDDAVTRPGIAIDDVRLDAVGYATDFEGGAGDWVADGWVWIDNVLPQQTWVQVIQMDAADRPVAVERVLGSGDGEITVDIADGVTHAYVAVSPFAPLTTVAMPYTLTAAVE